MANYFGIDFGTTNSAVVVISEIDEDNIVVNTIGEQNRPLPSYVAIDKETGEVHTGLQAKKSITKSGKYVVFSSIKSIIGEERTWDIAGKTWSQIDIATELFKGLKKNVEKNASMEMSEAVLAVPIGFAARKKENIRKAAEQAGIDIKMFISEPTAAYCSRIHELKKYKNIAIFDWGGGTLDVVVLRVDKNKIQEVSTVGMNMAGNDIDKKLAEKICVNVAYKKNIDFTFDDLSPEYQLRLLNACEEAKCNLADEEIVTISMGKLDTYGRVLEKINYDYFSLLIEDEVNKAFGCLKKALSQAGMNKESIDCILCVGGSSRLRPLQQLLMKNFDRSKIIFPRKAMWDIGSGAAQVSYRPGCYTLNKPIGIILSNNKFYPLLNVGQKLPTEDKEVTLGVVESSENGKIEARFVMSDAEEEVNQSFVEYFPVKLRGFKDEILKIKCHITPDLIFQMSVSSNRMPDEVMRVWLYENIKISYDIEGDNDER